jgi:hypothetical protein
MESLVSVRSAGADFTVTYFDKEAARLPGRSQEKYFERLLSAEILFAK